MNKQELERIRKLPDIMPCELVEKEFEKIIFETKNVSKRDEQLLLLSAYFELSERQWNNYTLLNSNLLNEIDSILITLWDKKSLENTETILGVIGMLGLQKTYEQIKASLSQKLTKDVKQEILEAIQEFGETVTNPYLDIQLEDQ
jgi:hypothetical protein